ncbi:hypothetical protein ILUMI_02142 [Ignelater luminosus]|uniref:Small ribosomal subunit protein bS16m n=1 Tax=Ignelater luminosus TaxID=2038154 RepID=A0A8K0DPD0_IGNLU|nr:hypothetical protein ILUMI_02142 [Ignelater luminosus]
MLYPSSGTGQFAANSAKIIRFVRKGCTNRPFFHIVVAERRIEQQGPAIEQLGTFDPMPNEQDEKLVSLNFERIRYWIGNGADTSKSVRRLLGLAGFYPVHPTSYITASKNRRTEEEAALKASEETKPNETSPANV